MSGLTNQYLVFCFFVVLTIASLAKHCMRLKIRVCEVGHILRVERDISHENIQRQESELELPVTPTTEQPTTL